MNDLVFGNPETAAIVVTGFFTPNYAEIARRFADNLRSHNMAHKLYAIPAREWLSATLEKPAIMERARGEFPDAHLVLMDVDCALRGPLERSIIQGPGDAGVSMRMKKRESYVLAASSSRVMVLAPTPGAAKFLATWKAHCREASQDEMSIFSAMMVSPETSFFCLPRAYRGYEVSQANADDIIVHKSVHDRATPLRAARVALRDRFRKLRNKLYQPKRLN